MRPLTIEVTTTENADFGSHYSCVDRKEGRYAIQVYLPQMALAPEWLIVAHELGHVLADEFNLPAHVERRAGFSGSRVLRQEEEAWDVTATLFRVRAECLSTYREMIFYGRVMKICRVVRNFITGDSTK